ncbi:uncharacterized protein LOC143054019 isoform X2 [Mytilus galloprovincialis]|uniref:uncharacterized protein LOC143054019 isoform X2 n=1 Tax=Mytilus galloprovincialis TaxID=29158 RepID=UPI003F7C6CFD
MLNVLLLIIWIPYGRSLQTIVHHHVPGITWNTARDICKPFDLENRHDYLQTSVIQDEQKFWIGQAIYKEPTPWIEIIGCYQIWENPDNPFHSVSSIGMCKHKCDSENIMHIGSYFGYRKKNQSNCVCQPKLINGIYQKSMQSCHSSVNFFVYQDYDGLVSMSSDPGNCTTVCCDSCNTPKHLMNRLEGRRCSSVDNSIVGRCGSEVEKWDLDYFGSLDLCIQHNELLLASNYCQSQDKKSGVIAWTNVFREEIEIIKTKDLNEDPVRCFSGVFIVVDGKRVLNVSEDWCSENKNWFIFKTNSSVTETITKSTLTTIDTSKDKQINISPGQSLTFAKGNKSLHTQGPINTKTITQSWLFTLEMSKGAHARTSLEPLITSSSHKTSPTARKTFRETDFRNNQNNNEDKSTSIGAMIGGILGACCILFVSAVLIICKIRSKGIFKETTKSVKEDTNQTHFSNIIYQDSNNTSDRTSAVSLSNQIYGLSGANTSVYAVVNKLRKLENTDATYTDTGYGEYDHLHDIHNRRICPYVNAYHSHDAPRN